MPAFSRPFAYMHAACTNSKVEGKAKVKAFVESDRDDQMSRLVMSARTAMTVRLAAHKLKRGLSRASSDARCKYNQKDVVKVYVAPIDN